MKLLLAALLIVVSQTTFAEFRVWCESTDGTRQWSPSETAGLKDCGDGIKHLSNVPPGCVEDGHFDHINCRMPTAGNRDEDRQPEEPRNENTAARDTSAVRPPANDLSGAVLTIMEHSRAREELIDEVSVD